MKELMTLFELTGQESGVVVYDGGPGVVGTVIVCNWAGAECVGLPIIFGGLPGVAWGIGKQAKIPKVRGLRSRPYRPTSKGRCSGMSRRVSKPMVREWPRDSPNPPREGSTESQTP